MSVETWKAPPSKIVICFSNFHFHTDMQKMHDSKTKVTTVPIMAQGTHDHLTNSAQSPLSLIFLAR